MAATQKSAAASLTAASPETTPQQNSVYQYNDQHFDGVTLASSKNSPKTSPGSSSTSISHTTDEKTEIASSIEKEEYGWEGYLEGELPEKAQGHYIRNLRHQIFYLYRRLFGVVFCVNLGIFIATILKGMMNSQHLGLVVVANLFVAILMRQDHVINGFFHVFCAVPLSWPLSIRRVCARVYHIGGCKHDHFPSWCDGFSHRLSVHSGCAVSGVMWLILFTIQATIEMLHGRKTSIPTVAVTYCILLLLVGMVIFAYPKYRTVAHDNFERMHRFAGWTATALVWCQVVLLINDHRLPGQSLGQALVKAPPFWLVLILTCSIISPWLHLRKRTVRAEVLSSHCVRLYFDYVTPPAGSFIRLSESPLLEWHSFATIAEPGMDGYSAVVSKVGDWTTRQIQNPPKEIWVRGVPTLGVISVVKMFRRVVLVATGSGIGPCTPSILAKKTPIRLLWTAPNVRETFGDKLVDSLLEANPEAVIYDTRTHGKPDMVKLAYKIYKDFDAEAVAIISNQKLTDKVVYGLTSRGIPTFGAIWDS